MKIYKKGTIVWLWCCTHDFQSKEIEEFVLDNDYTEEELEDLAKDFFYNVKEPEWGFSETKIEDDNY